MNVVFALFALLSIFWLAAAIPVLFIAGYLRTRRKGYRPPAATQVVLAGSIIGILAAYFIAARLNDRGFLISFVSLWVPVLVAAVAMALMIWLLPKRNPRVFGTRRPRFPFALAGRALIGLTVLVCLFAVVWVVLGKAESELVTKSLNLLLFGCAFGGYLMFLGRRVQVPESLEEIEQRDQRAPALYLRPFNQEWQFFVTGPRSRYGKYVRGVQRFTMILGESLSDTALPADQNVGVRFEEYFAGKLHERIGPFFALGNPEDYTPPEGATRTYATDADWKGYLDRLARKSSCIVTEIASSRNLRWEFEYLRRENFQQKLFVMTRPEITKHVATRVFFSLVDRLKGVRPVTWQSFAQDFKTFGYESADDPGSGAVVTFDATGKAITVTTGAHFPEEYVEPIRARLIESLGYSAGQLEPPRVQETKSPVPGAKASWRPRLINALIWASVILTVAMPFRKHIPLLRDLGVPGDASFAKAVALYERKQYAEALPYFKRAAAAGNTHAMNDLGLMYEKGQGVNRDDERAVGWYSKAADTESQAMVNLAGMYIGGRGGLPKDAAKAVALLRKAADAGNANGMMLLGAMYEDGAGGLPKDAAAALDWYKKAADLGNSYGQEQVKRLQGTSH
jgi:hypothetical protein